MKRPYECKVAGCDKSYTTRFSLRRHIASHSAIKQHVCVLCFKTFTLAQYLKEHTYIHTQQKPFKCDFEGCTRAFRQAGKLSMHKKVHQNIIFAVHRVKRNRIDTNGPVAQSPIKTNLVAPFSSTTVEEQKSPSLVTIHQKQQSEFGEDTEHELSLSRKDDSDLSLLSDCENDEVEEQRHDDAHPEDQEQMEDENDNSESLENSFVDQEESVYDAEAQHREDMSKLSKIFEKQNSDAPSTSAASINKVKYPYDMLIEKLIDSLDIPDLIKHKKLPLPEAVEQYSMQPSVEQYLQAEVSAQEESKPAAKQADGKAAKGVFQSMYVAKATAATAIGDNAVIGSSSYPRQEPKQQILTSKLDTMAPMPTFQPQPAPVQYLQLPQGAPVFQPNIQPMMAMSQPQQFCYHLQPQIQQVLQVASQPNLQLVQLIPVQLTSAQIQPQAMQPYLTTTIQYATPTAQVQALKPANELAFV